MTIPAQKFRELVFLFLYSHDMAHPDEAELEKLISKELKVTKKATLQAEERAATIRKKQKKYDELVTTAAHSYQFERIQKVERNILRLALFEMIDDEEVPPKVAISEAMRLSKKFSTPESSRFVNAVLDHIYQTEQGLKPVGTKLNQSIRFLMESEEAAQEASKGKSHDQDPPSSSPKE